MVGCSDLLNSWSKRTTETRRAGRPASDLKALEARGVQYAIRIPANSNLELAIEDLLFRSPGRPSRTPLVRYKSFHYQADSWTTPRRVVAKVEHHLGELFPRVGFIVTNLQVPSRAVVRFYNKRGTAEQWIKEGKQAAQRIRRCPCQPAERRALPQTVDEERTEGRRRVRKNVGGVVPHGTIRAADGVFRCEIDTGRNPDPNALCWCRMWPINGRQIGNVGWSVRAEGGNRGSRVRTGCCARIG